MTRERSGRMAAANVAATPWPGQVRAWARRRHARAGRLQRKRKRWLKAQRTKPNPGFCTSNYTRWPVFWLAFILSCPAFPCNAQWRTDKIVRHTAAGAAPACQRVRLLSPASRFTLQQTCWRTPSRKRRILHELCRSIGVAVPTAATAPPSFGGITKNGKNQYPTYA